MQRSLVELAPSRSPTSFLDKLHKRGVQYAPRHPSVAGCWSFSPGESQVLLVRKRIVKYPPIPVPNGPLSTQTKDPCLDGHMGYVSTSWGLGRLVLSTPDQSVPTSCR